MLMCLQRRAELCEPLLVPSISTYLQSHALAVTQRPPATASQDRQPSPTPTLDLAGQLVEVMKVVTAATGQLPGTFKHEGLLRLLAVPVLPQAYAALDPPAGRSLKHEDVVGR